MTISFERTPEEIVESIDFGYAEGLDVTKSDQFRLIVAIDLAQQSYEFTEALYNHFKKELEKEDAFEG